MHVEKSAEGTALGPKRGLPVSCCFAACCKPQAQDTDSQHYVLITKDDSHHSHSQLAGADATLLALLKCEAP